MALPLTEMNIKQPILDLVRREFGSVLEPPNGGIPREFNLKTLNTMGHVLANLLKYAAWISQTKPEMPVYLIHIISPEDSGWVRLCRLEGERLNRDIPKFTHVVIPTSDWPEQNPKWLDCLRQEIRKIVSAGGAL